MADLTVPLDDHHIPETWPAGLRVLWSRSGEAMACCFPETHQAGAVRSYRARMGGWAIDLSAPDTDDDGNDMWLDPFPWALRLLLRRTEGTLLGFDLRWNDITAECTRRHSGGRKGGPPAAWWPDVDGLDRNSAERAIVAAALRARLGLAEPEAAGVPDVG